MFGEDQNMDGQEPEAPDLSDSNDEEEVNRNAEEEVKSSPSQKTASSDDEQNTRDSGDGEQQMSGEKAAEQEEEEDDEPPLEPTHLGDAIDSLMMHWCQLLTNVSVKAPVPPPSTLDHVKEVAEVCSKHSLRNMLESKDNHELSYVLRSQIAEISGTDLTVGLQTRIGTQVKHNNPDEYSDPDQRDNFYLYAKNASGPLRAAIVSNHELHDFVRKERLERQEEEHVDEDAPEELFMMDPNQPSTSSYGVPRRRTLADEIFDTDEKRSKYSSSMPPPPKHLEPPPANNDYIYSTAGENDYGDSVIDLYGD